MRQAMTAYQEEKADVDTEDRATQVLKGILYQQLGEKASDVLAVSVISNVFPDGAEKITVQPSKLKETIDKISEDEGFNTEWVSAKSIGWQLKALRFTKGRNPTIGKREKFWEITVDGLVGLCQGYRLITMHPRRG